MLESLYGLLDGFPILATFVVSVLVSFLSLEAGFRYGRKKRRRPADDQEVLARTMVRSMLGLMSFTLAFTFWIAASHFDGARQSQLNDVNAIRAAYLRADLLPEPHRTEIRNLLREYVDVRLEGVRSGKIEQAISRSEGIQSRLWSEAISAREKTKNPVFVGYLIQSLSDVIAIHVKRVAVYKEFNIPAIVWVALYMITALAMASVGCHTGLTCASRPPVVPAFVLIFSVVMVLIADLDHPRSGAFNLSDRPVVDLRNMMNAPNG
ncbi:MAG TPA: hypothetical protein VIC84_23425 [Blastocatellia bacterium]